MSPFREHLSGRKTLPVMLNKHSTGAEVARLDENSYFAIPQENVLLFNNFCPVCTHIQVAIKKVILWKQRMHRRTETRVCKISGPD